MIDLKKAGTWQKITGGELLNLNRRDFIRTAAAGAAAASIGQGAITSSPAKAFAYEPYPRNNIGWLRETYEQEVTMNASDAAKLGVKTGDTVEV